MNRCTVPRVHRSDGNFESPDWARDSKFPAPSARLTRARIVVTCIDSNESMHCAASPSKRWEFRVPRQGEGLEIPGSLGPSASSTHFPDVHLFELIAALSRESLEAIRPSCPPPTHAPPTS